MRSGLGKGACKPSSSFGEGCGAPSSLCKRAAYWAAEAADVGIADDTTEASQEGRIHVVMEQTLHRRGAADQKRQAAYNNLPMHDCPVYCLM